MPELEMQKTLKELLKTHYDLHKIENTILVGNEFKNVSGHWAEKPDLIIFHKTNYYHKRMKKDILCSPIGIEFKSSDKLNSITTGVITQLQKKYCLNEYVNRNTKEKFKLNSLCFASTSSVKEGILYKRNFPEAGNFYIERFCWKGDVAVLTNIKNELCFSYKNWYFKINGQPFWHDNRWSE
jgi:hypothetical protein